MRKIIILLLVILLVGGLCGCRKEEDNTSSIISSAETQSTQSDDSSENSEETNSVESEDTSSSETPTQLATTDSSKKQTGAASTNSSASAKNDKPDSDPTPQAKDETSLDGDWIFYTSDWVRTGGTDCFVICLNIYNGFSVNISKGGYSLAENTVRVSRELYIPKDQIEFNVEEIVNQYSKMIFQIAYQNCFIKLILIQEKMLMEMM